MKIVGHLVRIKDEDKPTSGGKKLKLSSIFGRKNSSGKAGRKKRKGSLSKTGSKSSLDDRKKSKEESSIVDDDIDDELFQYGEEEVADYQSKQMTSYATEKISNGAIPGKLISEISPEAFGDLRFVDPEAEAKQQAEKEAEIEKEKQENEAQNQTESLDESSVELPGEPLSFVDEFWKAWEKFGKDHGISVAQIHFAINQFQELDPNFTAMMAVGNFVVLMSSFSCTINDY